MHELLGLGGITVSNFKKGTKKGTEKRARTGDQKRDREELMLLNCHLGPLAPLLLLPLPLLGVLPGRRRRVRLRRVGLRVHDDHRGRLWRGRQSRAGASFSVFYTLSLIYREAVP